MREGVAVLEQDESAWQAFALANAAMDRQARYEAKGERKGAADLATLPAGIHAVGLAWAGPARAWGPQLPGPAVVPDRAVARRRPTWPCQRSRSSCGGLRTLAVAGTAAWTC